MATTLVLLPELSGGGGGGGATWPPLNDTVPGTSVSWMPRSRRSNWPLARLALKASTAWSSCASPPNSRVSTNTCPACSRRRPALPGGEPLTSIQSEGMPVMLLSMAATERAWLALK